MSLNVIVVKASKRLVDDFFDSNLPFLSRFENMLIFGSPLANCWISSTLDSMVMIKCSISSSDRDSHPAVSSRYVPISSVVSAED